MVYVDIPMPKRCTECHLYSLNSTGNGMYCDYCRWFQEILYNADKAIRDDCPFNDFDNIKTKACYVGQASKEERGDSVNESILLRSLW